MSNTKIECSECKQRVDVSTLEQGVEFNCPSCDNKMVSPIKHKNIECEKKNDKIKVACHGCQQKFDVTHLETFSTFNCPSCGMEIRVPKFFDNYVLEECIGIGGMATVYRTLDVTLDREIAIKVLNKELAEGLDKGKLFLNEARTAATINHFAVVPIFTCGEAEGQPYIVMQYMSGASLEDKITQASKLSTQIPIEHCIKWITDIAEGLDNGKRHGIIHHDIKPANILLDNDNNAKLTDFGISQIATKEDDFYDNIKNFFSPEYVSPEKIETGNESFEGDIYSLGATLYHLVTLETPFKNPEVDGLLRARLFDSPKNPKAYREEIPKVLVDLILAMMARNPADRPTYREIIKNLNIILKGMKKGKFKTTNTIKMTSTKIGLQKSDKAFTLKRKGEGVDFDANRTSAAVRSLKRKNKKNKAKSAILTTIVLGGIVFGIAVLSWFLGNFDTFLEKNNLFKDHSFLRRPGYVPTYLKRDFHPKITKLLMEGNSKDAEFQARGVFRKDNISIQEKKQIALQLVFSKFLNNNPDAFESANVIYQQIKKLPNFEKDEKYINLLRYMSEKALLTERIEVLFKDDKEYGSLAEFAILLRKMYLKEDVSTLYKSFHIKSEITAFTWTNSWINRLQKWETCIIKETGTPQLLEPVFHSYIKNIIKIDSIAEKRFALKKQSMINKIKEEAQKEAEEKLKNAVSAAIEAKDVKPIPFNNFSADWLNENRKFAINRPKIDEYNFTADKMEYIKSIPDKNKQGELKRFEELDNIKKYVESMLLKKPFDGTITIDGEKLSGKLTMFADKSIKFYDGEYKDINWNNIKHNQMIEIIDYYKDLHKNLSNKKKESKDSFYKALMYDWAGDFKNCETATKTAKKLSSSNDILISETLLK